MKVIFLTIFRETAQKFNFMVNDRDVSDFFLSSIKEMIEYRERNDIKRNDFFCNQEPWKNWRSDWKVDIGRISSSIVFVLPCRKIFQAK